MTQPYFSVIIPVYQAEKHLRECIYSVQKQTFPNWEMLLIDDGSRDASLKICEEMMNTDSRIKVVSQSNSGAAQARNRGTELAHGEYILYLDSDDYWEDKCALEKIHKRVEGDLPDICLFGCIDEYAEPGERIQSRGNYDQKAMQTGDKATILESLITTNEFPGSCWIMAVRTKLLDKNKIWFISGHRAEDIDWVLKVLCAAKSFAALNEPFYIYRKAQANSVTGTAGLKSLSDILETISAWTNRLKTEPDDCGALNTYIVYIFFTTLVIYNSLRSEDRRKADCCYKKVTMDFSHVLGVKIKLLSLFYQIAGHRMTCLALKLLR